VVQSAAAGRPVQHRDAAGAAGPSRVGSVCHVFTVLLVAISVGLSNFAASIGLGAAGADARTRLRIAVIFGLFEGGMPAVGLLLGRETAGTLGPATHWAGAGLLIATGGYGLIQAARAGRAARAVRDARAASAGPPGPAAAGSHDQPDEGGRPVPPVPAVPPGRPAGQPLGRLILTGLALSLDNLVVGFAVGTFPVSLAAAVIVIAAVSVGLSLAGLELGSRLGARLGARTGSRGEVIGGLALIGVGIALAAGAP
jgi:manganese efflux pump family protein